MQQLPLDTSIPIIAELASEGFAEMGYTIKDHEFQTAPHRQPYRVLVPAVLHRFPYAFGAGLVKVEDDKYQGFLTRVETNEFFNLNHVLVLETFVGLCLHLTKTIVNPLFSEYFEGLDYNIFDYRFQIGVFEDKEMLGIFHEDLNLFCVTADLSSYNDLCDLRELAAHELAHSLQSKFWPKGYDHGEEWRILAHTLGEQINSLTIPKMSIEEKVTRLKELQNEEVVTPSN